MSKKFTIIESFNHFIPTGFGWIEGLTELGHEVYTIPTGQHDYSTMSLVNIDWAVFMGMPDVQKLLLFKQLNPSTKIAVVCFGFSKDYLLIKDCVDIWLEHTYKHDLVASLFEHHGMNLHFLPLAASTTLFKPIQADTTYDLSFIGQFGSNGHGYRHEDRYLYPLMQKGYKGFYSGFGNHQYIQHSDIPSIYSTTKINLNFHYQNQKQQSTDQEDRLDFNGRVFEIAMCGGFQLCDHPNVLEYFGEGIVYSSMQDWEDMFEYYLNNDRIRIELAEVAQKTVLEKHSWKVRMNQFLNIIR